MRGRILYTVRSDVFRCPVCNAEIVFWDVAVDRQSGRVRDRFPRPSCGALHTKRTPDRAWETVYDRALRQPVRHARQVPVLIRYSVGRRRYEKTPDAEDLALLAHIEEADIPLLVPLRSWKPPRITSGRGGAPVRARPSPGPGPGGDAGENASAAQVSLHPELPLWLLEAAMRASPGSVLSLYDILHMPALFPFRLEVGLERLHASPRFLILRNGDGEEWITVRTQARTASLNLTKPQKSL